VISLVLLVSINASFIEDLFLSRTSDSELPPADDACWLTSYGRGVGVPISVCAPGLQQDAALCYPYCEADYSGVGPVCWENCPAGFTDTGADCLKPPAYGRGAGYVSQSDCQASNSQGCEEWGLLWYPICDAGFYAFGCCVCSPDCPPGMPDIGVSCQKNSYGRGAGVPLVCTPQQQEDAALCYPPCNTGFTGNGPVCWGNCPSNWYVCGALCIMEEGQCTGEVETISDSVLVAILDIVISSNDTMAALINVLKQFDWEICSGSEEAI